MFLIITVLLGLIMGSFLNVVIYRLPIMINNSNIQNTTELLEFPNSSPNLWLPHSFCCHCKKILTTWEKIPVFSYLVLGGKSRCCQTIISARYLIVEVLSVLLAWLVGCHFGLTLQFFLALILTWGLVALFFIDLATFMLPDQITLPLLGLGLFANAFSIFTPLMNAVLGGIFGYLFFYLVAFLMKKIRKMEVLGEGDFKLIAMLAVWFGWEYLPAITLIASFLGSIYAVIFIFLKRERITARIPFGPFLSIAGFLILICGNDIYSSQSDFRIFSLIWC